MRRLSAALLLVIAAPAAAQQIDVSVVAEADGSRTLSHEIIIPAPLAAVWEAVSTPEGWRTWAVPLARAVPGAPDRFETGYDAAAAPGAPSTIEQMWLKRTAPYSVTFRTTRTPQGFPHAETYLRVTSSFTLTPINSGETRVRLTGSGYAAGPAGDTLIGFFREGNRASLQQLHTRFTTGPSDWAAMRAQPKEH